MRKEIAQAVKANRRMLGLVDDQLSSLAKTTPTVALDAIDADRRMPYWYVATAPTPQAVDAGLGTYTQKNGQQSPYIPITNGLISTPGGGLSVQYPNIGYIRVQSDAAFVATTILTSFSQTQLGAGGRLFGGTFYRQNIGVRLYDESSNRWLTLTNQNQRIQQDATLPGQVISPSLIFFENGSRVPTECVFPRNALIRVEIYYYDILVPGVSDPVKVYFSLGGYKVFGG